MNWKSILVIILLVVLFIFIVYYPLQFEFYENLQAKKLADFIFIPFYGILVLYDLYKNIVQKERKWKKYFVDFLKSTAIFSLAYLLILRWFFSCCLLVLNAVFGEKETVKVSGIITEIVQQKGSGKVLGTYTINIQEGEKNYFFHSKGKVLKNYTEYEYVELHMKKGVLNLLYK
ncbi:hypothetical protein [Spongiimicrobium salis]|uniref:hypothetical protein n=1 Tax=Spongiimicrobium salis TaxID=1667022 RepID=UPI00374CA4C0